MSEIKDLAREVLDMIKFDLQSSGFKVKLYKEGVYGAPNGMCLQVMGGHLLSSMWLFVDGSKLIFSRFQSIDKQRYSRGGLHYMELADPNARPAELLLKLFKADAELKKNLRSYGRNGF
jgi:hypothetical protein